jgi:hypothetical protein
MSRIAKFEQRRLLSLFWFLVGFLVWQGTAVGQAFFPSVSTYFPLITGLSLLGWAVWTYHLVRMLLLKREMSDQEHRQMNDERVQKNRWRSFTVGFWAMLVATAPLLLVQNAFPVATAAELLLLIGIGSSIGAFLYFESAGVSTIFSGLPTGGDS